MTRKISFNVENVSLVDERNDSQFSLVAIDAFASGNNLHELYVPEEVLMKTADSIYEKPIVWEYNRRTDDIGTHSPLQVPAGFVDPAKPAEFRQLEDGRTMMRVFAKVWNRYCGRLLEFFQRDGKKPVSVEMEVYEIEEKPNEMARLLDFCYTAITVLGSSVTPAIPGASSSVVKFAEQEKKEYEKIFKEEFSRYSEIDFTVSAKIKKNCKNGLDLHKQHGGGTPIALAMARFIVANKTMTPDRARNMSKYFMKHAEDDLDDTTSSAHICWQLYGGFAARKWVRNIVEMMDTADEQRMSYFSGENTGSEDGENLGKEENVIYMDEEQKDVEETPEKEECAAEEMPEKEECASETEQEENKEECAAPEQEQETPEGEKEEMSDESEEDKAHEEKETPEEESKEEETEKEEPEKEDMSALMSLFAGDEFAEIRDDVDNGKFAKAMTSLFEMLKNTKEQFSDYDALKQFKQESDDQQFKFAVEKVLNEVAKVLPEDKIAEAREDAKNFSLENMTGWANCWRAKAFEFSMSKESKKEDKKESEEIVRFALPNAGGTNETKSGSVWNRLGK